MQASSDMFRFYGSKLTGSSNIEKAFLDALQSLWNSAIDTKLSEFCVRQQSLTT